jgi:hypothetical protein
MKRFTTVDTEEILRQSKAIQSEPPCPLWWRALAQ